MNKRLLWALRIGYVSLAVHGPLWATNVDAKRTQDIVADYKLSLIKLFEAKVWNQPNVEQAKDAAYRVLRNAYDPIFELYGQEPLNDTELRVIWNNIQCIELERRGTLHLFKVPTRTTKRRTEPSLRKEAAENVMLPKCNEILNGIEKSKATGKPDPLLEDREKARAFYGLDPVKK